MRLALWYALLFVAGSALVVGLTYVLLADSLEQRDRERIRETLTRYAAAFESGGLPALNRMIGADQAAGRYEPLFVRILGRGGDEAIFFTLPGDWRKFDLGALSGQPSRAAAGWTEVPGPEGAVLEVASARLPGGILFQVGKSSEGRVELLERFRERLTLVLLSIAILGLTGGALLTYSALQPIRSLIRVVRTILQTGEIRGRVPLRPTGDDIEELTLLFNSLLDRVDRLLAGMRGALDAVAHDLRTPVMRLRSIAESALQSDDGAELRNALADCLEEAERLVTMLDTLMDISEAETGTLRLNLERLRVSGIVHEVVELYSDLADDRGVEVRADVPASLAVRADRNRLRQVLANLVDNAIKYTPAGGRVALSAAAAAGMVEIRVEDTGIGIPPEEMPRIWERLYRGDESRSARGLGLGLSLVKAIVQAHGGRVAVTSAPGQGSRFGVTLPAAAAEEAPDPPGGSAADPDSAEPSGA